jgi:hypothetical protein
MRAGRITFAGVAAGALVVALLGPLTGVSLAGTKDNLVRNAGFENGLRHWAKPDNGTAVATSGNGHSGASAAKLTAGTGDRVALRDQPNTVRRTKAGTRYRVSAWVRASTPGAVAKLRVREVLQGTAAASSSSRLVSRRTTVAALSDRAWHRVALDYVPATGNQLAIVVVARGLQPTSALFVDDVAVVPTAIVDGGAAATPTQSTPPKAGSGGGGSGSAGNGAGSGGKKTTIAKVDTAIGTSVLQKDGQSWAAAVSQQDASLGRSSVMRVFYPGMPQAWPGRAGVINRDVVVSFRAKPQEILTGRYDSQLRSWFATAPSNREIYWSYYHEPEENISAGQFTAAQYRQAWVHVAKLADAAHNSHLKATLILMAWSLQKGSHRNWKDYYPGSSVIDVLGWDAYNQGQKKGVYWDPSQIYQTPAEVSKAEGKPFGFPEWGSSKLPKDNGSGRAAWIRASASYISKVGATFATYWDSNMKGDFRLLDTPSRNAMREAIAASK